MQPEDNPVNFFWHVDQQVHPFSKPMDDIQDLEQDLLIWLTYDRNTLDVRLVIV